MLVLLSPTIGAPVSTVPPAHNGHLVRLSVPPSVHRVWRGGQQHTRRIACCRWDQRPEIAKRNMTCQRECAGNEGPWANTSDGSLAMRRGATRDTVAEVMRQRNKALVGGGGGVVQHRDRSVGGSGGTVRPVHQESRCCGLQRAPPSAPARPPLAHTLPSWPCLRTPDPSLLRFTAAASGQFLCLAPLIRPSLPRPEYSSCRECHSLQPFALPFAPPSLPLLRCITRRHPVAREGGSL